MMEPTPLYKASNVVSPLTHCRCSVGRDDLGPSISLYICDFNSFINNPLQIKSKRIGDLIEQLYKGMRKWGDVGIFKVSYIRFTPLCHKVYHRAVRSYQ